MASCSGSHSEPESDAGRDAGKDAAVDGGFDSGVNDGDSGMDAQVPQPDAGKDAQVVSPEGGVYIPPEAGPVPFPTDPNGKVLCGSVICACDDGVDNDTDGVIDAEDPECVARWDNDEGSLATGIPGDNRDLACQDCFFDGNSGSGNDTCRVPTSCFTSGTPESGQGSCSVCEQPASCASFCEKYTPNGCDCFGCCDVMLSNGTVVHVALGPGCNIDGNDVTGCTACVPNDTCRNECGTCELCPGKTVDDLPAECFTQPPPSDAGEPPPPPPTCDNGETPCGPGLPSCPANYSCEFGCCTLLPVILL